MVKHIIFHDPEASIPPTPDLLQPHRLQISPDNQTRAMSDIEREPQKQPQELSAKAPMLAASIKQRQPAGTDDGAGAGICFSVGGGVGSGPDCGATENEGLEEHTTTKAACTGGLGYKAELDAVKEKLRSVENQLRCARN